MLGRICHDNIKGQLFVDIQINRSVSLTQLCSVTKVVQTYLREMFTPSASAFFKLYTLQTVNDGLRLSIEACPQLLEAYSGEDGIIEKPSDAETVQSFTLESIRQLQARQFVYKHFFYAPYKGRFVAAQQLPESNIDDCVHMFNLYKTLFNVLFEDAHVSCKPFTLGRFKAEDSLADAYMGYSVCFYDKDDLFTKGVYHLRDDEEFPSLDDPPLYHDVLKRVITQYDAEQLLKTLI